MSCFFGLRQHAVRQTLKALDESSLTENLEHADGVMDAKDADAIKEVVKRSRAKLEEQLAVRYVTYSTRASLAGVVTADRGQEIAKEHARLFISPGATLNVDVKLHWRWIGEMPKRENPEKVITKAWQQSVGRYFRSRGPENCFKHAVGLALQRQTWVDMSS